MTPLLSASDVNIFYGEKQAVRGVNLDVRRGSVNALIGPSGCGKTTFLRAINRMHDLTPGARVTGRITLDGEDVYGPGVDPVTMRRRVGMVFQKPNPFPTMSVFDNVVSGLKLAGVRDRKQLMDVAERSLRGAALWDEVKDRLKSPATGLSGGQQQRLCIARALAVEPEILLMDEPTSALDPASTARIEDLMAELKKVTTIIIVTHNMHQAARVSDTTSFFLNGELVEHGVTDQIFTSPRDERTEAYVTGRFG
ncbi:phosphate ABC transporter ATP-binding protein [Deinococcus metallilatus]|uniref:Phosphate ABC transporter ATP-binding protein n=1 Tax=Deinococcus metallilatus TaxID=1211322 RepID=A0AAJ5F1M9_9DEIO|nr:phosphate ABC transporter ATP-binding protein PstB [Deinococcus metallilatus]MBB5296645.1 phosphate transport system ATP-binding protein [Deinococcus metallilatus]QBY09265.1 phosphate ABC transporter ATP-binding protein [Deinococcus metallilatus]RXJ09786.1 phosphate ABC transporter ATP-binding protein [Deinococcus metallilatus]TLK24252.1 phosphate ABC transporter ATP-binding protein [Deinococcus metallilatus]GMA13675.1 phosphate import ATP-binding protein PstB [Deinococcus metallilatus]